MLQIWNDLSICSITFTLVLCFIVRGSAEQPTVVHVHQEETLNEVLAGVEGAIKAVLPEGVTEYDRPITRRQTTVIRGQGKNRSVLRPNADVKLVQQTETIHRWGQGESTMGRPDRRPLTNDERDQPNLYDGSLVFSDLTINRAHRPAPQVTRDGKPGPNFLLTTATGTLAFRNVRMEKFDFADRQGVLMHAVGRLEKISFRNVTFDLQAGGGVTNRPRHEGGYSGRRIGNLVFDGDADRFLADRDTLFRGNTLARPPRKAPNYWGSIMGLSGNVFEQGDVNCEFQEWDYGAWKGGGPAAEEATLAFRGDNLNAGFGDQYWPIPRAPGGHLIFEGISLTSAENNIYHDYGLKTTNPGRVADGYASLTIRDCSISRRGNPIGTINGGFETVEIRNVEIAAIKHGLRIGEGRIGRLEVDGLTVYPHETRAYYNSAVHLKPGKWGPEYRIANVNAKGYLDEPIIDQTDEDAKIQTENIRGEPARITYEEGMDFGLMPGAGTVDGNKDNFHYDIMWRRHPGTFRVEQDFTVFEREQKTRDKATIRVSYDADVLYCSFHLPGQGNVPPSTEELTDGQVVRIAIAPDDPKPDAWVEIDVARTPDGHRAYLQQYPDGDGRVAEAVNVASSIDKDYHNMFLEVAVPWSVTPTGPDASSIRFDVGIRNANDEAEPIGFLQLFDTNGVWSSHDPADYKRVQLLGPVYGPGGDPRAGR